MSSTKVTLAQRLNKRFEGVPPADLILGTAAALVAAKVAYDVLQGGRLLSRIVGAKDRAIRVLLARMISKEIEKAASSIEFTARPDEPIHDALPEKPMSKGEILALAHRLHDSLDSDYTKGGLSGTVYHGGAEHTRFVNEIMEIFQWTNPLHVDVYGAVRKMEAEVVQMVLHMYNGHVPSNSDACGALTSGGTESIGMAIKSYRDWGRATKNLTTFSVVMPITAHPAFDKACQYYGLDLIKVPVEANGVVDPARLEKYIRHDTVAIVGSAPNFPYGVVDPIADLGQIAIAHGIGLHVDACLGGFIVPFMHKAGFLDFPIVDFRVAGVTTISCDTHKYGFAPKGTSVVLYRSKHLRSFQFFTCADWPGGIYCSPGASGSKAGNVIAGTWAAMLAHGDEGYVKSCRDIVTAARKMALGVRAVPFLRVNGDPRGSVFSFTSDAIDVYELSAQLKKEGWMLNPIQFPAGIQFSVTLLQTQPGIAEKFCEDVQRIANQLYDEVQRKAAAGEKVLIGDKGSSLYGSQQRITDRSIIADMMKSFLNGYYSTDHPERAKRKAAAASAANGSK